eukprot:2840987-Rhodomonas_salina.1
MPGDGDTVSVYPLPLETVGLRATEAEETKGGEEGKKEGEAMRRLVREAVRAVSYTHLTLPTICSV